MKEVGGLDALRRFTSLFYEKAFADPVLDKFIRSHADPHGNRFARWVHQKLTGGTACRTAMSRLRFLRRRRLF